MTVSLSITTSSAFSAVCSPSGSSYSSLSQTISTTTFNARQYFLYAVYTSGQLYPVSLYYMKYLPFGLNTSQSKAITGNTYSITLPFAVSSLAYLLSYTISVISCPTTCTLSSNKLTVTSPSNSASLVFKISTSTDSHYSKLTFSVSSATSPSFSSLSAVSLTSSGLLSQSLTFTDAYYGTTDLYTHSFAYSTSSTDSMLLDTSVMPPVFYWYVTASGTVSFTVTNIGGASGTASLSCTLSNAPVLATIPALYGWTGCSVSYTPVCSDTDGDTLTLSATPNILSGSNISWDPRLGTSAVVSLTDGTTTVTQTVTLTEVATPSFLITSLYCYVGIICISTYAETYSLSTELASITSTYSSLIFGSEIYLTPTAAGTVSATLTVTSTYGCTFAGTIAITTYALLSFPLASVLCDSSGDLAVTSAESLSGVSLDCSSSLSVDAGVITGSCTSTNYYCSFSNGTGLGFQAFGVTAFDPPEFGSIGSIATGVQWEGSLKASNCAVGECIYTISGPSGLSIGTTTGYASWTSPADTSFTLYINRAGTSYSNVYTVTIVDSITLDTIDQSLLQVYLGASTSITISTSYSGSLTLSSSPSLTIAGMEISISSPSASATYSLTAQDTSAGTSSLINLRLYVLSVPAPYLPTSFNSNDLYCEVGTSFSLDFSKCKKYADLKTFPSITDALTITVSSPFSLTGYVISYASPVYGTYSLVVTASYATFGKVTSTSTVKCLYPLAVSLPDASLYYGETYTGTLSVTRNGAAVTLSSLKNVWIAGNKPSTMTLSSSGAVDWTPSSSASDTYSLSLYVKDANSPAHSATGASTLTLVSNTPPVFTVNTVPSSEISCTLDSAAPRNSCYLLDTISDILPGVCNGGCTYAVSTTDSSISLVGGIVTWDRSSVATADLDSASATVTAVITDVLGVTALANSFIFTPIFIAVISDLSFSTNYPGTDLLTAFTACLWEREFTITEWTNVYPSYTGILDSQISVQVSDGSSPALSRGVLQWYPATAGNFVLTIYYTNSISQVVSATYAVLVYQISTVSCSSFTQTAPIYINAVFTLNLSEYCATVAAPDGSGTYYTNVYAGVSTPSDSTLTAGVLLWTPTAVGTSALQFQIYSDLVYNIASLTVNLILQEQLAMSISSTTAHYGLPFYALIASTSSDMPMSMLSFSLVSSNYAVTISSFGDLECSFPVANIVAEVMLSLSGTYYIADSTTSTFTITLADNKLTLDIAPLGDSYKIVTIGSTWTLTANCVINQGSVTISTNTLTNIAATSISQSQIQFSWTPSYTSYTPENVEVTCISNSGDTIHYYFTVLTAFPQTYTATCTSCSLTGERGVLSSGYISWSTEIFNLNAYKISCDSILGMTCYHYGYYEWLPTDDPGVSTVGVYINGVHSCDISITYYSKPVLSTISPQYCDGYSRVCSITLDVTPTGTSPISLTLNDTTYASVNNNVLTWTPSVYTTFNYLSLTASNSYGSDEMPIFFCQGVACRYNPAISTATANENCSVDGNGVTCSLFYPQEIIITITGINFGTSPYVYIGELSVSTLTASNTQITCYLPYPNFGNYQDIVVYIKNSQTGLYSTGYQLISYEYPFTPVITSISSYYIMESSGSILVKFMASLILPVCTCKSGSIPGTLIYTGIYSTCSLSSSPFATDTQYSLSLCCFSACSNSINFMVYKDISLSLNATTGHNHGGYLLSASLTFSGIYIDGSTFVQFGDTIYSVLTSCPTGSPCSFSLVVPPSSSCTSSSASLLVSLNGGLDFTAGDSPQVFQYTGCCGIGNYQNDNECTACPAGYYCPSSLNSPSSVFLSPVPCDLGYYSGSTGTSSCTLCPYGYQCYCRGTSAPVACEAGFYCNIQGTTKRRNPCPQGRYCPPGSFTENASATSGLAPLCDPGTYCIYGIFTNQVADEKYHAHYCRTGYTCAAGSDNEFGVTECSVNFFCPASGFDTSGYTCASNLCECPPGYMCPTAQLILPVECSIGQYQPASMQSSCINCPAGYYCPYTTARISKVACPAGSYCPGSTSESTSCSLGYYQPNLMQTACIPCPAGTYQSVMGSLSCKVCSPGHMCPYSQMSAPIACTEGYFCGTGVNMLPLNTCANSTDTLNIYPLACPTHYYCPEGSSSAKICKVGTYSLVPCVTSCTVCSAGYICLGDGTQTICAAGYYCSNNYQYSCPPGYYCLQGTSTGDPTSPLSSRPFPCSVGTYCSNQNTNADPNSGITGSAQFCGKGTYNNAPAMSSCLACPEGYQCPTTGMINPVICPAGTYRENDLQILSCVSCAEGYYNSQTGSYNASDCLACEAGPVCRGMGMSYPNSTNSRKCSAGFYCPAGTGSGSSSANPCPTGTYCFEGSTSLAEAIANLCPAGRYCTQGTAASADQVPLCANVSTCEIGSPCSIKFYCPQGTLEMMACPEWTTSSQSSFALGQCFRDSSTSYFYSVRIIKEEEAVAPVAIKAFGYTEFAVEFLQYYAGAVMPVDYQAVMVVTPVARRRRLMEEAVRVLIIANDNYGVKQAIPLPYAQAQAFQTNTDMVIGINSNIDAEVSFELQFLNGSYFSVEANLNNVTTQSTMEVKNTRKFTSGFLTVVSQDIGSIFEDPINLYTTVAVDDSSKLLQPRYFENRFFASMVTNTSAPLWSDYTNLQNTTSIWGSRNISLGLTYVPYFTECSSGYGSFIPLNVIMNDSRCEFADKPSVLGYLSVFTDTRATSCRISMECMYDLELNSLNRAKRWYEASTYVDKSKITTDDLYPPFYITKTKVSAESLQEIMDSGVANIELIPVTASRVLTESWESGQYPCKIEFTINYFVKSEGETQILSSTIIFSKFTKGSASSGYTLEFNLLPLSWVQSFDLKAFEVGEYILLLLILCGFQFASILLMFLLGFLIKPVTLKLRGVSSCLSLELNCIKGFILSATPISILLTIMMSMLMYIDYFKYIAANFTDKTVITDINSIKVVLYLASRAGVIFLVVGLLLIRWGTHLIVPTKAHFGFSYEAEVSQIKEITELPRRQGFVLGSSIGVALFAILMDSLSNLPIFQTYYFIIWPVLLIAEYLFKIMLIKYFEDEIITLPARIGIKVAIYLMILNCYNFHVVLLLYTSTYLWRFVYSAFLEKYNLIYAFEFIRKMIEKREISESTIKKHHFTYAASELSERSLNILILFLSPVLTLFIYQYYELYAFMLDSSYFLYFILYQILVVSLDPLKEILLNFIRIARDSNFRAPEIFERANLNYKQRLTKWALSLVKIHDEKLKFSPIEIEVFMAAWSSQLFFALTPFGFGIFLVAHACKMWKISNNSPFMDYWMFMIGVVTLVASLIIKEISQKIGKLLLWKISNLNQLFIVGADGKQITSREQYIDDAFLKKKLEGDFDGNEGVAYYISDFAENLMDIIKDNDDHALIKRLIADQFREKNVYEKINHHKIFEDVKNRLEVLKENKLDEIIKKTEEAAMKISLINVKKMKNAEVLPRFPPELIYPW